MRRSLAVLFVLLGMTISACATKQAAPTTAAASDAMVASADLPEIAPYDDEPFELLPEVVPVVDEVAP